MWQSRTPWILGSDGVRWHAAWSFSDLVLSGHTELVLVALHQVGHLEACFLDGHLGYEDPHGAGASAALQVVACDGGATVAHGRSPRNHTWVLEDLLHLGFARGSRLVYLEDTKYHNHLLKYYNHLLLSITIIYYNVLHSFGINYYNHVFLSIAINCYKVLQSFVINYHNHLLKYYNHLL